MWWLETCPNVEQARGTCDHLHHWMLSLTRLFFLYSALWQQMCLAVLESMFSNVGRSNSRIKLTWSDLRYTAPPFFWSIKFVTPFSFLQTLSNHYRWYSVVKLCLYITFNAYLTHGGWKAISSSLLFSRLFDVSTSSCAHLTIVFYHFLPFVSVIPVFFH